MMILDSGLLFVPPGTVTSVLCFVGLIIILSVSKPCCTKAVNIQPFLVISDKVCSHTTCVWC